MHLTSYANLLAFPTFLQCLYHYTYLNSRLSKGRYIQVCNNQKKRGFRNSKRKVFKLMVSYNGILKDYSVFHTSGWINVCAFLLKISYAPIRNSVVLGNRNFWIDLRLFEKKLVNFLLASVGIRCLIPVLWKEKKGLFCIVFSIVTGFLIIFKLVYCFSKTKPILLNSTFTHPITWNVICLK